MDTEFPCCTYSQIYPWPATLSLSCLDFIEDHAEICHTILSFQVVSSIGPALYSQPVYKRQLPVQRSR